MHPVSAAGSAISLGQTVTGQLKYGKSAFEYTLSGMKVSEHIQLRLEVTASSDECYEINLTEKDSSGSQYTKHLSSDDTGTGITKSGRTLKYESTRNKYAIDTYHWVISVPEYQWFEGDDAPPSDLKLDFKFTLDIGTGSPEGLSFTDVKPGTWYYEGVAYAVENGLFNGVSAVRFAPGSPMTRGMFATVLGRRAGIDPQQYKGRSFSDVSISSYYAPYIKWASEQGIINGTGGNRFSPDTDISRQDIVTMLYRYVEKMGGDVTLTGSNPLTAFSDRGSISGYGNTAMRWAVQNGIIEGAGAGKVSPGTKSTRAQVAKVMMNAHDCLEIGPPVSPIDPGTYITADGKTTVTVSENGTFELFALTGNGSGNIFLKGTAEKSGDGYAFIISGGNHAAADQKRFTITVNEDGSLVYGGSTIGSLSRGQSLSVMETAPGDQTGFTPVATWKEPGIVGGTGFIPGKYVRKDGNAVLYVNTENELLDYTLYVKAQGGKSAYRDTGVAEETDGSSGRVRTDTALVLEQNSANRVTVSLDGWESVHGSTKASPEGEYQLAYMVLGSYISSSRYRPGEKPNDKDEKEKDEPEDGPVDPKKVDPKDKNQKGQGGKDPPTEEQKKPKDKEGEDENKKPGENLPEDKKEQNKLNEETGKDPIPEVTDSNAVWQRLTELMETGEVRFTGDRIRQFDYTTNYFGVARFVAAQKYSKYDLAQLTQSELKDAYLQADFLWGSPCVGDLSDATLTFSRDGDLELWSFAAPRGTDPHSANSNDFWPTKWYMGSIDRTYTNGGGTTQFILDPQECSLKGVEARYKSGEWSAHEFKFYFYLDDQGILSAEGSVIYTDSFMQKKYDYVIVKLEQ